MNATNELTHEQLANEELTKRICNSLAAKRAELSKLRVRVDGGTVYLTGRVGSFHARQVAVAVAQHVAGVHQIVDDVVVVRAPAVAAPKWS